MAALDGRGKANFLRLLVSRFESHQEELLNILKMEDGIEEESATSQIVGMNRQLFDFAELLEEGNWVDARIDPAQPDRKPVPKPDMRAMLRPLGPVLVFCAEGAPLVFSIVGREVVSAWASGCPCLVMISSACGQIHNFFETLINRTLSELKWPEGCFSLLSSDSEQFESELVQNTEIMAIAFTGPKEKFRAALQTAQKRKSPVLIFEKNESLNPVFFFPGFPVNLAKKFLDDLRSLIDHAEDPYYPVPAIIFHPEGETGESLLHFLITEINFTGIKNDFEEVDEKFLQSRNFEFLGCLGKKKVPIFSANWNAYLSERDSFDKKLGPSFFFINYCSWDELGEIVASIKGQWRVHLFGSPEDLENHAQLVDSLELKAGELHFNQRVGFDQSSKERLFGGPFPVSSDFRTSHYPSGFVSRFCRPVCYQNFPDEFLPTELQRSNPLGLNRYES
tara:strand:- start:713 stop:2062 length:1350 start_codon:yes stop_codon:yes gene_type:complete